MSTMIERVARAILAESYRIGNTHGDFDALSPEVRGVFTSFASAAIAEMRVPTESMISEYNKANDYARLGAVESWQAMIDAALREEA